VHATVRVNLLGLDGASFTTLSRPPDGSLGPGVWKNYALTNLIPYRGGVVELNAGLSALAGESALGAALDALQDFSSLIVPPVTEALGIAQKVSSGVERLLTAGNDDLLLAFHDSFSAEGGGGQSPLEGRYVAIVNTTESLGALTVVEDRLHASGRPVEGRDYMLFRIEGRRERDDWRFRRFEDLRAKAIDARLRSDEASFLGFRNTLLAEALSSPDLTVADQQRAARAFKKELEEATEIGRGMAAEDLPPLEETIARHAPSLDEVAGLESASLEEILAAN
jgi:hypothetical protein